MTNDTPEQMGQSFLKALSRAPFSIVMTNPRLNDNPIVYVNDTFTRITGYAREFAIGKNCRFLQGDENEQENLKELRHAIKEGEEVTVNLRNFRSDGELFFNRLMISPLFSDDGDLTYFLGIQMEIEAAPDAKKTSDDKKMQLALTEIQHRVKNHLAMVVGMIRLQAHGRSDEEISDFKTLARRVETLQLLYEELSDHADMTDGDEDDETVALGAYLSRVANAIAHIDGRSGVRVNIDAQELSVPFEAATQLGLILSEVMTNAMQHAFTGRVEGLLEVEAKTLSNGMLRILITDDGVGIPGDIDWPSQGNLGSRIINQLIRGLDAQLEVSSGELQGTTVTIDVPKSAISLFEKEVSQ